MRSNSALYRRDYLCYLNLLLVVVVVVVVAVLVALYVEAEPP
jgi:uncharacterized membrane protein YidH (DUF202 family)